MTPVSWGDERGGGVEGDGAYIKGKRREWRSILSQEVYVFLISEKKVSKMFIFCVL